MLWLTRFLLQFLVFYPGINIATGHLWTPSPANADCSFNDSSLCGWSNGNQNGDAMWMWINKEKTGGQQPGPTADYSGSGLYLLFETSKMFIYDDKAILTSPVIQGPKSMIFYYNIYGEGAETLAVTANTKKKGILKTMWSRTGSHRNSWNKSCVFFHYDDLFKIDFEATVGSTNNSGFALDEIRFFDNLTLCQGHDNGLTTDLWSAQHTSANCNFDGTLCGWRTVVNKMTHDGLLWKFGIKSGDDHKEDSKTKYTYTNRGNSSTPGKTKAYLISPRLFSPYCMALNYSIRNINSTLEVVSFRMRNPHVVYKLWQNSNSWNKSMETVHITLPPINSYDAYQVLIIATPSYNIGEDILLFGVTFKKGLCKSGYINHGDCNFEGEHLQTGMCLWHIVKGWRRALVEFIGSKKGLQQKSGTDKMSTSIVVSASHITPSDTAQLISPWMIGQKCMHFNYLMHGKATLLVAVYAKKFGSVKRKLLWVKSGNSGGKWYTGELYYTSSVPYQFVIEAKKNGNQFKGFAALDDIMLTESLCKSTEIMTFYLSKREEKRNTYKIEAKPPQIDSHLKDIEFQIAKAPSNLIGSLTCIYRLASQQNLISNKVYMDRFPLDCFNNNKSANTKKIYMMKDKNGEIEFKLSNRYYSKCCTPSIESFLVKTARRPGIAESSKCGLGWYHVLDSCFHFIADDGDNHLGQYNKQCAQLNSVLATLKSKEERTSILRLIKELNLPISKFITGKTDWQWADGSAPLLFSWDLFNKSKYVCGAISRKSETRWILDGVYCTQKLGFICEENIDPPNPSAIYPLNGASGTKEASHDPLPSGEASQVSPAEGPHGNQNGSHFFSGTPESFIHINHSKGLDFRSSITFTAWIFPEKKSGAIIGYVNG